MKENSNAVAIRKKAGFTLIELIVVIAILVILAVILIPLVGGYIDQAADATGTANVRTVYSAATAFAAEKRAAREKVTKIDYSDLTKFLGSGFGDSSITVTLDGNSNVASTTWTDKSTGIIYTYTVATGAVTNSRKKP